MTEQPVNLSTAIYLGVFIGSNDGCCKLHSIGLFIVSIVFRDARRTKHLFLPKFKST